MRVFKLCEQKRKKAFDDFRQTPSMVRVSVEYEANFTSAGLLVPLCALV